MKNQNYVKFEERTFYFTVGLIVHAIAMRINSLYGVEAMFITAGISLAVVYVWDWICIFKDNRNMVK